MQTIPNRFFQIVEIDKPQDWIDDAIQCQVDSVINWGEENFVFFGDKGVLKQILDTYLNGELRFKTQNRDLLAWALGGVDGNPKSLKKWKKARAAVLPESQTKCATAGA